MLHFHPAIALLLAWVYENGDALINASLLLGGLPACRRTARLVADLMSDGQLTRRHVRELKVLHGLLSLEHVCYPHRDESVHFAAIDPADPVVHEICMLSDGLSDRIGGLPADLSPSIMPERAA